jgi:hypothetical protein
VEIVIDATMPKLAELSQKIGAQSFAEFTNRLMGCEPFTVRAALETLTEKGDAKAAANALTLRDFPACKEAFEAAFLLQMNVGKPRADTAGNDPAGDV